MNEFGNGYCYKTCHAQCCGPMTFPAGFIDKHPMPDNTQVVDCGFMVYVSPTGSCPYLGADYKCTVYEDRLPICRAFGCSASIHLTCPYLDICGKLRSQKETEKILNDQKKNQLAEIALAKGQNG